MGCLDDSTIYDFASGSLALDAIVTIDAHIDGCDDCRLLVAGVVRTAHSGASTALEGTQSLAAGEARHSEMSSGTLLRGQALGDKYLILDVLGQGAMGTVYAAWDSGLERKVAIKTVNATAQWSNHKERFVREAQAMAKIAHPNVVFVHEVVQAHDMTYIVMEFVEGGTLREWSKGDWARDGRGDWRVRRDMCVLAGRGLAAAHEKGLVHRDFKPENVIVGADGRPRVTDFGLVALSESSTEGEVVAASDLELTMTGAVMGTPAYMAPEQFRAEAVSAKTDQYAFCATAWELLVGSRPIVATHFEEQLRMVLSGELPEAPSGIPTWLSQALLKGLAANPDERHESMDALLEAMTVDSRVSPGRRVGLGLAVAGLGIAAALFAGRGYASKAPALCTGGAAAASLVWNAPRAQGLRAMAGANAPAIESFVSQMADWEQRFIGAHTETCKATHELGEQSPELLDIRMNCLEQRATEADALLRALEGGKQGQLAQAPQALADLPSLERCSLAQAFGQLAPTAADSLREPLADARALLATGQYWAAVARLPAVVTKARTIGFAPLTAEAQLVFARATWKAGFAEEADGLALEALLTAVASGADFEVAAAWIALMGIAGTRGAYDLAVERSRHAEAAVERVGAPEELLARLKHGVGVLLYNRGDLGEALVPLNEALALRKSSLGAQHTLVASSHTSLGNVSRALGSYREALGHHEAALLIDTKALGTAHPNIGRHEHNIAGVYRLQGKMREAREHYERALVLKSAALGETHVDVALTLNSLGLLALAARNFTEAEFLFAAAEVALTSAGHADRASAAFNRGVVAAAQARHTVALGHLGRALDAVPAGNRLLRADVELRIAVSIEALKPSNRRAAVSERGVGELPRPPESGAYVPTQSWD